MFSYKLAPEFPYPQPVNDCYEVAKYVLENPLEFNGHPDKIILAGESAGIELILRKKSSDYLEQKS